MIKKRLFAAIETRRERMLAVAIRERRVKRQLIVDEIYKRYKDQRTALECRLLPYTTELCLVPEIKERIDAGLEVEATPEAFSGIEERLPDLILTFKTMLQQEVQVTLAQTRLGNNETVDLNLATSVLRCKPCNMVMFGWSEIQEHHCIGPERGLSSGFYQQDPPNFGQDAMFCLPSEALIFQVITLAGLDPATASITDMDAADMSYFCSHCLAKYASLSGSKYYYSWRSIVGHGSLYFPDANANSSILVLDLPFSPWFRDGKEMPGRNCGCRPTRLPS